MSKKIVANFLTKEYCETTKNTSKKKYSLNLKCILGMQLSKNIDFFSALNIHDI